MKRAPVISSSIRSVGYAPEERVLEIEFVGGGVYRYLDVPSEVHEALLEAESKGTFVNRAIKGRYRYQRV